MRFSAACGWTTWVTVLLACAAARAQAPQVPPPDHVVPAWYLGMPVMMRAFELGSPIMREEQVPGDSDPWKQRIGYIVGVADASIGASPRQRIALPDGRTIVIPPHQGVLPCLATPASPVFGIAYSVLPGPAASAHDVRADPMPEGSVIGGPLANAIRIGPTWVPLTSHEVIEYGLHKGLLRLRFFGANPVHWATPDWDGNYPYMASMVRPCTQPARAPREFMLPADPTLVVPAY